MDTPKRSNVLIAVVAVMRWANSVLSIAAISFAVRVPGGVAGFECVVRRHVRDATRRVAREYGPFIRRVPGPIRRPTHCPRSVVTCIWNGRDAGFVPGSPTPAEAVRTDRLAPGTRLPSSRTPPRTSASPVTPSPSHTSSWSPRVGSPPSRLRDPGGKTGRAAQGRARRSRCDADTAPSQVGWTPRAGSRSCCWSASTPTASPTGPPDTALRACMRPRQRCHWPAHAQSPGRLVMSSRIA